MRTRTAIAGCLVVLAWPLGAFAQSPAEGAPPAPAEALGATTPTGPELLARVDAIATQAADFTAQIELTIVDAEGESTSRTVAVWQKGADQRLVKILAPPRLRGVGLLAQGDDVLHLYLPAFGKVRRVAGQDRGKSFFDSDFTQDDMARTRYGDRFLATLAAEDPEHWMLRLDPKDPGEESCHHLVLKVRKADDMLVGAEFFDSADGASVRRLTASDFRPHGSLLLAHTVVAEDLKTMSRSTAALSDVQVDTGIEDDFFTTRHLKRAP